MLDLYKQVLVFSFIFVFLSSITLAIDECRGTINQDDIPCLVLLPNSSTNCDTITTTFYDNSSTQLYTQTMHKYNSFTCNATFNQSDTGTYTFYYSTGDSGSIIVEEGLRMIYLLYFALALIIGLLILAIWQQDQTLASVSAILMIVVGTFIGSQGFNELNNMVTNGAAIVLIALGAYILLKVNMENF